MLLSHFLCLLNNFRSLLLSLFILFDVSLILITLEILSLIGQFEIVGDMAFTANTYHEIFPVLPYDNDKNDKLCGTDSRQGCQSIHFIDAISFNPGCLTLNKEKCCEGTNCHGNGAVHYLTLELAKMRLIPVRCLATLFLRWNLIEWKQYSLHQGWCAKPWLLILGLWVLG